MKLLTCIFQKVKCWLGFHTIRERGRNFKRYGCGYCHVKLNENGKVKKV